MIDPDDRERAALHEGLKLMAEVMGAFGWTTRLNELTEAQAAALAEAAVDGFLDSMQGSAPRLDHEVPF